MQSASGERSSPATARLPRWAFPVTILLAILVGTVFGTLPERYALLIGVLLVGLPFAGLVIAPSLRPAGVAILLAFVPLTSILKAVTGSRYAPLTFDLGILLACALQLADGAIRGRIRLGRLDLLLGAFLVLAFLQMFNPNVPSLQAGVEGFRKFAFMSLAFYAGRHILRQRDVSRFRALVVALSVFISAYGLKQFISMSALDRRMIELATAGAGTYLMGGWVRPFSTLPGPFHLGSYLVVAILLVMQEIRNARARLLLRLFFSGLLVLQVVVLFLTRTKGNWVGLAVGIVALVLLQNRRLFKSLRKLIPLGLVFVLVAVTLPAWSASLGPASATLEDAVFAVTHPLEAPTFQYRLRKWRDRMIPAMLEKPFAGYGTSSSGEGLRNLYEGASSRYFSSHNLYMKVMLELGLPGVALFLLIVGGSIRRGRKALREADPWPREEVQVLQWSLAVVTSFLVAGLVIPILDAYPSNYYFWLLLGLLSRRAR